MNEVRKKATILRRNGYSYNEINKKLGIPKSTLSGWFSSLVLSKKAQNRLEKRRGVGTDILIERNKRQTHDAWKRARKRRSDAKRQIKSLSKNDLFLLGIALYWAEGHKKLSVRNGREITSHVISFTNSDPVMIEAFIIFLKQSFGIEDSDINVGLRLFEHINEKEAIKYWKDVTKLPQQSFIKPTYVISRASQGKRPYNRLPYGTVQVRVNSTEKFHTLMGWVEGIKKKVTM